MSPLKRWPIAASMLDYARGRGEGREWGGVVVEFDHRGNCNQLDAESSSFFIPPFLYLSLFCPRCRFFSPFSLFSNRVQGFVPSFDAWNIFFFFFLNRTKRFSKFFLSKFFLTLRKLINKSVCIVRKYIKLILDEEFHFRKRSWEKL